MKKISLFLLSIIIMGCSTGSSNLQAIRIEKPKESPIGLSKQNSTDLVNSLKEIKEPIQGPVTKEQSEQGYKYLYEVPTK